MAQLPEIERGDVIATKDGREMRVLTVYKNGNAIHRIEGIDDSVDSPIRTTVYSADITRILRKAKKAVEK